MYTYIYFPHAHLHIYTYIHTSTHIHTHICILTYYIHMYSTGILGGVVNGPIDLRRDGKMDYIGTLDNLGRRTPSAACGVDQLLGQKQYTGQRFNGRLSFIFPLFLARVCALFLCLYLSHACELYRLLGQSQYAGQSFNGRLYLDLLLLSLSANLLLESILLGSVSIVETFFAVFVYVSVSVCHSLSFFLSLFRVCALSLALSLSGLTV